MATLTTQTISEAGVVATFVACEEAGDQVANTGIAFLCVKNVGGEAATVSVTAEITSVESPVFGALTKSNATQVISDGEIIFLGPFDRSAFSDSDDYFQITYSPSVEGLTIAALEVG